MVGKSSSSLLLVLRVSFFPFCLMSSTSFLSYSLDSSFETRRKSSSRSRSSLILSSMSAGAAGASSLRLSNMVCTLKGILNFSYGFCYWFFFLFFLPLRSGSSSSCCFLDLMTVSFLNSALAEILASSSSSVSLTSFFSSVLAVSALRLLR